MPYIPDLESSSNACNSILYAFRATRKGGFDDFLCVRQDRLMAQGYGARIAQARRLLSVAMEKDVTQAVLGDLIGSGLGTVSRWESEEMRPRRKWLEAISQLCAEWGIAGVTPGWLDYAEGQGPLRFLPVDARGGKEAKRGPKLERPSTHKTG